MKNKIVLIFSLFLMIQLPGFSQFDFFNNQDSLWGHDPGNFNPILYYYTSVHAMMIKDGYLYLGGNMTNSGNITSYGCIKWDGNHFHSVGDTTIQDWNDNLSLAFQNSMLTYHNVIYGVGEHWDFFCLDTNTNHWINPLPPYDVGSVWTLAVYHDSLIIGGDGYNNPVTGSNVDAVAWYDNQFHDFGTNQFGCMGSVYELVVYNDELYAAGAPYLARYAHDTIGQWEKVGGYADNYLHGLMLDTTNNFLWIVTNKIVDGTVHTDGASIWNGFYFEKGIYTHADSTSINGSWGILDLAWYHGKLYATTSYGHPYPDDPTDTIPSSFWYIDSDMRWKPVGGITIPLSFNDNTLTVYKDDLYWGARYYPQGSAIEDTIIPGIRGTFGKWHAPQATGCFWLMPRVLAHADTFYLPQGGGTVDVPLYNNNAYADSWQWDFDDGSTDTVKDPLHTYSQIGTYHVQVTVTEDGCTKTAEKDIVIMEATGIADLSLKDLSFKIYPNPTKQDFTVEISLPENIKGKNEFFVTGMGGANKYRRHIQSGFNRFVVSTTGWQPATYICNLMAGNKFVGSKKLVLTK